MSYKPSSWVDNLPAEITVCDTTGILLQMNACAEKLFKDDGGGSLIGSDALACHPEPSRTKLTGMLEAQYANLYMSTEKGEKRFFFQSPWYKNG